MKRSLRCTVVVLAIAVFPGSTAEAEEAAARHPALLALERELAPGWTQADEDLQVPVWLGDEARGALVSPMFRGAAAGIEDYVFTPPDGDCANARGVFRIDWNERANTVRYQLKFKKVPVRPEVRRTAGVDFFPNPLHRPPKDFENGGYRFWTVFASGVVNDFYYDAGTLLFVGSQWDFPRGQPPGTIKVSIPVIALQSSRLMLAERDGSLFHEYTVPYDCPTVEGGAYSFGLAAFVPLDLCEAHPVQPTLGQLRPWVSPWLPPDAPGYRFSFRDMLERGLVFDTTVDENQPFPATNGFEPYVFSGVAFIGNEPVFQGGVPNGYRNSLQSLILGVSPGVVPLEGGNGPGCRSFLVDPHIHGPRFCEMSRSEGRP